MKTAKKISSFCVDAEIYNKFHTMCERQGLKLSPVIEALMEYLINKEKEIEETPQ